jgi:hypothetical protein
MMPDRQVGLTFEKNDINDQSADEAAQQAVTEGA